MTRRSLVAALPFVAAILVHLPPLGLPLIRDDYHTLHQAALTWAEPGKFLEPWMGGAFRALPKLYFMGSLRIFGEAPALYRLVNLALHLFCTWQVMRLTRRWTDSNRVVTLAALLFGMGFGGYLRPVFQISNATMLGATAFLLPAIGRAADRRWLSASALFTLAALCHEVVLVAPLLVPLILATGSSERPSDRVGRLVPAGLIALAVAAILPIGRVHEMSRRVLEQTWFFLFPINTPERILRRVDIPAEVLDVLLAAAHVLTTERASIGLGLLVVAIASVFHARRARARLGVAWVYLFLIPPAWLIVTAPELGPLWQHGWLERRYLYLPGAAACALAGAALVHVECTRRRLARTVLACLVAWIVLMDGITWDNYRRLSQTGDELDRRARFEEAMRELTEDR